MPAAILPLFLFSVSLYFLSTLALPDAGSRPTCSIMMPHYLCPCCLFAGIGRKSIPLSSPNPPPFIAFLLHVSLPLLAAKCPFWTEHNHQHNIMPYQSRHKGPWAHCSSVSASSSFSTLPASAKPPKHSYDHKQDNRLKTGAATKIFLGKNASLIVVPVNYGVL